MLPKSRRDGDSNREEAHVELPDASREQHGLREALKAEQTRADGLEVALNGLIETKAKLGDVPADVEEGEAALPALSR